ncbi:hypothetical protein B0T10DRAFT_466832 [Thelonectria olida]|uniref:Uncharacterized protein n=1 Tax=Thelonectria olida TaxID=1576542 RepID=A0A9P8VPM5_9HYPO|nr:hypothetical protein B0T10DRAFT_466832 [Thelonectria olida]
MGRVRIFQAFLYPTIWTRPTGWNAKEDTKFKINQQLEDPQNKERIGRTIENVQRKGDRSQQQTEATETREVRDIAFAGISQQPDRYQPPKQPVVIYTGGFQMEILGYGQIHLQTEGGLFELNDVAYIPAFHTSVASLDIFIDKGYNWNPAIGAVFKGITTVFYTRRIHRQRVIEFDEVFPTDQPAAAFSSSSNARPPQAAESTLWRLGLGHLNAPALESLVKQTGTRMDMSSKRNRRMCPAGREQLLDISGLSDWCISSGPSPGCPRSRALGQHLKFKPLLNSGGK